MKDGSSQFILVSSIMRKPLKRNESFLLNLIFRNCYYYFGKVKLLKLLVIKNKNPKLAGAAVALSVESSAPVRRAQVRGRKLPCVLMALVHVKSVVGAICPQSSHPNYTSGGYQSGGAIPFVAYQNCDGMFRDHPEG